MNARPEILTGAEIATATQRALLDGYGAEDIAIRTGRPATDIRAEIADLRRRGVLPLIVKQARDRARMGGGDARDPIA